jgi:disulfide bond formation protein DsbB
MVDMMPFTEVVGRIVTGGGDCQAITWTFAGLSMPAWVLILVAVTGGLGTAANLVLRRPA